MNQKQQIKNHLSKGHQYFKKIICCFLIVLVNYTAVADNNNQDVTKKRVVRILSIDGGGVRGIVPAYILAEIEKQLPGDKKIGEYFDIIAGTSAGGIMALMLTAPDKNGKPKYSASYILDQTQKLSEAAFETSWVRKILTGGGLWHVKYSSDNMRKLLHEHFGDMKFKDATTNVVITTYEISTSSTYFFQSSVAKETPLHNCLIRELAYATSAAPTYFEPAKLTDDTGRVSTLIDGGVAANNPTVAALLYATELYGREINPIVISIGTGSNVSSENSAVIDYDKVKDSGMIGWMTHIIHLLMYTSNDVTDYIAYRVLDYHKNHHTYFRLQVVLDPKNMEMDDITESNINALRRSAKKILKDQKENIDKIVSILQESN
jgi:patatin-like phospholipase/acyl hydrolase